MSEAQRTDGPQATPLWGVRVELAREVPLTLELPSFYWSRPAQGVRVIAFGEAVRRAVTEEGAARLVGQLCAGPEVEWLGEPPDDGRWPASFAVPGPWLGAAAFDAAQPTGRSFAGFGHGRFFVPQLLSWTSGGRHFACALAAGPAGAGVPAQLRAQLAKSLEGLQRRLAQPQPPLPVQPALFSSPPESESRAHWDGLIDAALAEFAAGRLHKVVAARAIEVRAQGLLDPRPALLQLERRHPTCRIFCLRGDDGAYFLGATPELLCTVDGRELATEALAGTARTADAARLLRSGKDGREHRWVVDHLLAGLDRLAERVTAPPAPRLRELTDFVHLLTPISARLKPGVSAGDVLAALHPTPAVAGVPSADALRFLAAREGLRRGLYAGPVGLLGAGRAELAVALRSALLRGDRARLFAGAGLVEGSSAEEEWRETEMKAAVMLSALGAAERPLQPARASAEALS
jgi:isochorismate synthase